MNAWKSLFQQDIILDEQAFTDARKQFEELGDELKDLRSEIETLLETLRQGYNTTAGRKFVKSCEKKLTDPLNDQAIVLQHISETLAQVQATYDPVFTAYTQMNDSLN